jgi:hypothetical protein
MIKKHLVPILSLALLIAGGTAAGAQTTTGSPMAGDPNTMGSKMMPGMDRFGGPTYTKSTDLPTTIAFVNAGGGPGKFSTATALTALVGADVTSKEVAKLTTQYGKPAVDSFVTVFSYAVNDATKIATADGIAFPAPALSGDKLAGQIIRDGTADGTFETGYLLDHLLTHKIHDQVMGDIDAKYGAAADASYHKISNQAMYDIAQALGDKNVMLASLH